MTHRALVFQNAAIDCGFGGFLHIVSVIQFPLCMFTFSFGDCPRYQATADAPEQTNINLVNSSHISI